MPVNYPSTDPENSSIDTTNHTVDQLIQLWFNGEVGVDDGRVHGGVESIEVVFECADGELTIPYKLSECCATRTDEEGMFDIVSIAEGSKP